MNLGIIEVDTHWLNQAPGTPVDLAGFLAPRDKLVGLVVFIFIRNSVRRVPPTSDRHGTTRFAQLLQCRVEVIFVVKGHARGLKSGILPSTALLPVGK